MPRDAELFGKTIEHSDEERIANLNGDALHDATEVLTKLRNVMSGGNETFNEGEHWLVQANPSGKFGCATVYVNGSDKPIELEPLFQASRFDKGGIVEVGQFGGFTGGPIGNVAAVKLQSLDADMRKELEASLAALKGELTYERNTIGDFGCKVTHSGVVFFETSPFRPIPDQFFALEQLAESLSIYTGNVRGLQEENFRH
jgi:hypothetical protein